jgi:transcriptional regulator with XRE-family HTH domain
MPHKNLDTFGDRLRWAIEDHMRITQAEFARRLGVWRSQVTRWIKDNPPGEENMGRIAELTGLSAAWLRYGDEVAAPVASAREADEEEVSPNYEGLGVDLPGYERLLERPRRVFDRFMVELIGKGLGREDLEELGRGLLNPIAALNTLHKDREVSDARSEEDQMMVLNGMMPVIRKIVREGLR